ncbi:DUF6491 family protein [Pseudomonas sp. PL-6]|jgi:hypothetical protein
MVRFSALIALSLALALGACTQRPAPEALPLDERLQQLGYRQGESLRSVLRHDLDGWQYLDKQHLLFGRGPGRAYLVSFTRPCNNLNFSSLLSYRTTLGMLTPLDHILVHDQGGFAEPCLIDEIHALERIARH